MKKFKDFLNESKKIKVGDEVYLKSEYWQKQKTLQDPKFQYWYKNRSNKFYKFGLTQQT